MRDLRGSSEGKEMTQELTILVVDDAMINRGILKNIFDKEYQVIEAYDGQNALEILQQGNKVDIILLDIIMPRMDGIEFLQIIKSDERFKGIPVLVNSLASDNDNEFKVYELGADDFISKPYNPVIVKRKVDNIVRRYINLRSDYEKRLEDGSHRLRNLMEIIPGGLCVLDTNGEDIALRSFDDGLCRLSGFTRAQLEQKDTEHILQYIFPEDVPYIQKTVQTICEDDNIVQCSFRLIDANGDERWIKASAKFLLKTETGIEFQAFITECDTEDTYIQDEFLQYGGAEREERDVLTGIYHRESFYEKTANLIQQDKTERKYVILKWNIDNFKVVNELFGNKMGDGILKRFSAFLWDMFSDQGVVGRLESDHFAVCTTVQIFSEKYDEIKSMLSGKKQWGDLKYPLMFHIGVYEVTVKSIPVSIMCDRAELALLSIKDNYLKRIAYYDAGLKRILLEEQQLVNDMEQALELGQFFVQLQPIISAQTGLIESAEALVRWNHPVKGILSPMSFIPLFEKNEFVTKIDLYVCEEVCKYQKKRKEEGKEMVPISINLSRLNFYNPSICDHIIAILERYGLTQEHIKIEVTETVLRNNQKFLIDTIYQFHEKGFLILMDDFGSGYSSLNMLKDVYVDILKIDMRFMDNIETSERANNILYSIIQMAKRLQIKTIAEGIETQEQFNLLRSMGCDMIQGFFFSKPVMIEEYDELLYRNHKESRKPQKTEKLSTILVVDDLKMMRETLEVILGESYHIIKAEDGYEALQCLKENFGEIDLVLSDIYMPKCDGFELLENMQQYDYLMDIPVIMLTAYGESDNERRAIDLGALDVISKPFDSGILKKKIENILSNSKSQRMMLEVNALRESMKIKSRVQKIYTNNKAGIACFQVPENRLEDNQVRVLYCNERMAQMHGLTSKNQGGNRYTIEQLLSNLEPGQGKKYINKINECIKKRQGILQYRYKIRLEEGVKSIVMNATLEYNNGFAMIDAVSVEDLDSDDDILKQTLIAFSEKNTAHLGIFLWQYDLDQDTYTFISQGNNGCEAGRTIRNAFETTVSSHVFQEKDIPRVRRLLERMQEGESFVSDEFLMERKNVSEEEKQFHWMAISYERIDSGIGNRRIALAVAEDITEMSERKQRRWREKQYLRIMTEGGAFFAEVDINENRFLDERTRMQLCLFGVVEDMDYDGLVSHIVSDVIYPDESSFCTHLLSRDYISAAFRENRYEITFDFHAELFGDAEYQWYTSSMYLVKNPENGHIYASWKIKNIQKEKNKLEEIKRLAERDQMTGLLNRIVFERRVDEVLKNQEKDIEIAFIMIDIDNFKSINDNFGHSFGDSIIRTMSKLLTQNFREYIHIGRLGGDEFAVFIPQVESKKDLIKRVADICDKSHMRFHNKGEAIDISCSVGVAFGPEFGTNFQNLYVNADRALYMSKSKGKNQFSIYAEE